MNTLLTNLYNGTPIAEEDVESLAEQLIKIDTEYLDTLFHTIFTDNKDGTYTPKVKGDDLVQVLAFSRTKLFPFEQLLKDL